MESTSIEFKVNKINDHGKSQKRTILLKEDYLEVLNKKSR